ncbi:hypothetical protein K438DRAFT_1872924 [Mycena galopus ATCC 62051]|nr:hypothetical protein K438DRAFT_1872924 [Mycena galopus ATCC 62051]
MVTSENSTHLVAILVVALLSLDLPALFCHSDTPGSNFQITQATADIFQGAWRLSGYIVCFHVRFDGSWRSCISCCINLFCFSSASTSASPCTHAYSRLSPSSSLVIRYNQRSSESDSH